MPSVPTEVFIEQTMQTCQQDSCYQRVVLLGQSSSPFKVNDDSDNYPQFLLRDQGQLRAIPCWIGRRVLDMLYQGVENMMVCLSLAKKMFTWRRTSVGFFSSGTLTRLHVTHRKWQITDKEFTINITG
jgi:hypothetical protein